MNLAELLASIETVAYPGRGVDMLVAAGVAAAIPGWSLEWATDTASINWSVGGYGERFPALLSWTDPSDWLRDTPDAFLVIDWWDLVTGPDRADTPMMDLADDDVVPVRLAVTGIEAIDQPAQLLRRLRRGRGVAAVVAADSLQSRGQSVRWSWPLRLARPVAAVPGGQRRGLDGLLRDQPRLRDIVDEVDSAGPWARASLAILPRPWDEPADHPGQQRDRLRAGVVIGFADMVAAENLDRLRQLASRHSSWLAAIVNPGPDGDDWTTQLLLGLARGEPLDLAIHRAGQALFLDDPVILAAPDLLDQTRFLAVLARELPGFRPDEYAADPVSRITRGHAAGGRLEGRGAGQREHEAALFTAQFLRNECHHQRRVPLRTIQARVSTAGTGVPPGSTGEVLVWIGCSHDPEAAPAFPADRLPPDRPCQLTVVLTDLAATLPAPLASRQTQIWFRPDRPDSDIARFPIRVGAAGTRIEMRVAVLYRQRFLQTGLLRGTVGSEAPVEFEVESVARADLEDLDLRQEHDIALILNANDAGTRLLTAIAADYTEITSPLDKDGVEVFSAVLERPNTGDEDLFHSYHSAENQRLLVDLARRGRRLYEGLFPDTGQVPDSWDSRLRKARRISILSVHPGAVLPLEFVYDRPLRIARGNTGRLCPTPSDTAESCEDTCPHQGDLGVVCPFGFWGMSKVIERHVNRRARSRLTKDHALGISPDVTRHTVELGDVVAAASDRADCNDAKAWTNAVGELSSNTIIATSWGDLDDQVKRSRREGRGPGVVVLIPHVTVNEGIMEMEIGSGETMSVLDDPAPYAIRGAAGNPMIFVLGCGTGSGRIPLFEAPTQFLSSGAPAVVATLTAGLGRYLVPVAVALLTELRAAAAAGGKGCLLGEAMLRARRRCVLEGLTSVLMLISHGDTDWQLTSR